MNKLSKKIIAAGLGVVLAAGTIGITTYADTKDNKKDTAVTSVTATNNETAESDVIKDEMVYVLTDAQGNVEKTIVSDWLKNAAGLGDVADTTELENIEVVKGDESFNQNGNALDWKANGSDIYYQGYASKELPVSLKVTYTLDGKEVNSNELPGASGHLVIRYDYINNQYVSKEVNGKTEKIYVPYACMTGLLIDTDTAVNVDVKNGKLINDGNRSAIVGYAISGLKENLGVDTEVFEIPSYVEISADVTDFELGNSITVVTNELFSNIDETKLDSYNDLSSAADELSKAMTQLMDGSTQLSDGLSQLLEKSGELAKGVDALAEGSAQLSAGAEALSEGTAQLSAGAANLCDGAGQLKNGAATLSAGAASLDDGAAKLSAGLNQLTAANDSLNGGALQVFNMLLGTANEQLSAANLGLPTLTVDNYDAVLEGGIAKLQQVKEYAKAPEQVAAATEGITKLTTLKASLDSYNTFYTGVITYTTGVSNCADGAKALSAGAKTLSEGATSLATGAATLAEGTTALSAGANSVDEGAKALSAGMNEMNAGVTTLKDGMPALTAGVTALSDGATALSDGLNEFNEKGISKITALADGDIQVLIEKFKATIEVSKSYNNFSGLSEDMNGQVKFIYRTDVISK